MRWPNDPRLRLAASLGLDFSVGQWLSPHIFPGPKLPPQGHCDTVLGVPRAGKEGLMF